jgi:hypothetical protein
VKNWCRRYKGATIKPSDGPILMAAVFNPKFQATNIFAGIFEYINILAKTKLEDALVETIGGRKQRSVSLEEPS